VVNPVGGRGKGLWAAEEACSELRAAGWEVELLCTEKPGHARELSEQAAKDGCDLVLACGGDGTFSQVVTGLLDTGIPAGLIPAGTGNDFARAIGLPIEPREAAKTIISGRAAPVDLLEVDGGQAWAVNIIGTGFDAAVAERTNRRVRFLGGRAAYIMAVAAEVIRHRPARFKLQVDDQTWEGEAMLVAIANSSSYGGGMLIALDARIDDGLADVVLVEKLSRLEFIRCFPMVFKGTHLKHPKVKHWRGKDIRIETDHPQPALVDGDVIAHTPLAICVQPGRALVWLPKARP
jgi:diacylglycerol kinase (ATP)